MTAADQLARWREAEQGATEGPWFRRYNDIVPSASDDDDDRDTRIVRGRHGAARGDKRAMADATFIATSREAMPALLAFVQSALVLADGWERKALAAEESANARGGLGDEPFLREHARTLHRRVSEVRSLAEQHLTTSSTPTTGEGMDKPAAVTGSGRTANTGGLDSPGVGTSTTKEQS